MRRDQWTRRNFNAGGKCTREAREGLLDLEAERAGLESRRRQLDGEIAALEGRLHEQTRQLLGVEE
jgi:hypothetical protein